MAIKIKPIRESAPEFKLPKSFEIGGMTVEVILDPNLLETHGAYGMMDMDRGKLFMQDDLSGDVQAITFHHEVVHMILNTLGKSDLNGDEGFVDGLANLLWQALKTAKY